jgi:diguanylate cyclase (GGDEF)-like protein
MTRIAARLRTQAAIVAVITGTLVVASAVGLEATRRAADAHAGWVQHTQEVIASAQALARSAIDSQNGMRGYLLARERAFLRPFIAGNDAFRAGLPRLQGLVAADPAQARRVETIRDLFDAWQGAVAAPLIAGAVGSDGELTPLLEDGKRRMDALRAEVDELIRVEEQTLQRRRAESLRARRAMSAGSLVALGLLVVIGMGAPIVLALRIARAASALGESAASIAAGDLTRRVPVRSRDELGLLAASFNAMADRLAERSEEEAVLNRMREMLHAAQTVGEAQEVLTRLAPRCLRARAARLFLTNDSRNQLTVVGGWGEGLSDAPFAPEECWSLRSGRPHAVADGAIDVPCAHGAGAAGATVCLPLTAQGETIGLLHLATDGGAVPRVASDVGEMLALTLANLRLRDVMRNQAVRDALTGLYNRRYLDETFPRELARATRARTALGVVVLDLDHFKRFNDTHGHGDGDALLKQVGVVLRRSFRESDVVCRYGGEEFVALLPDCDLANAVARAEAVAASVRELTFVHGGRVVAGVTASAGVAAYPLHGREPEALFHAADRALYRSKAGGRDRVTAAEEERGPAPGAGTGVAAATAAPRPADVSDPPPGTPPPPRALPAPARPAPRR